VQVVLTLQASSTPHIGSQHCLDDVDAALAGCNVHGCVASADAPPICSQHTQSPQLTCVSSHTVVLLDDSLLESVYLSGQLLFIKSCPQTHTHTHTHTHFWTSRRQEHADFKAGTEQIDSHNELDRHSLPGVKNSMRTRTTCCVRLLRLSLFRWGFGTGEQS